MFNVNNFLRTSKQFCEYFKESNDFQLIFAFEL